ncbi:MAG: hypothetical protein EOP83_28220 [Verrucomicrobiaceae bacterium]|nr:MAG: hypothetical protein EOP83_28220 [Verrucomicrobiaceae bacterium]
MYSMPNDMVNGKLSDPKLEENFPHHVYLNRVKPGTISMAIYGPSETIAEWLDANGIAMDFRKNIIVPEKEIRSPFDRFETQPVYCFKRESDAIAFKLRWAGTDGL